MWATATAWGVNTGSTTQAAQHPWATQRHGATAWGNGMGEGRTLPIGVADRQRHRFVCRGDEERLRWVAPVSGGPVSSGPASPWAKGQGAKGQSVVTQSVVTQSVHGLFKGRGQWRAVGRRGACCWVWVVAKNGRRTLHVSTAGVKSMFRYLREETHRRCVAVCTLRCTFEGMQC